MQLAIKANGQEVHCAIWQKADKRLWPGNRGTTKDPACQTSRSACKHIEALVLSDVEAGKVDEIAVFKVDRLTRSLADFAQFEREVSGERIRDRIAASKRKGMWTRFFPDPQCHDKQLVPAFQAS